MDYDVLRVIRIFLGRFDKHVFPIRTLHDLERRIHHNLSTSLVVDGLHLVVCPMFRHDGIMPQTRAVENTNSDPSIWGNQKNVIDKMAMLPAIIVSDLIQPVL